MDQKRKVIRVGTRSSELALIQTHIATDAIRKVDDSIDFEILTVSTSGDKNQKKPIHQLGCTNVFVKEVESELISGNVDIVVHSLKDVCTAMDSRITLAGFIEREDPRDCVVFKESLKENIGIGPDRKFSGWSLSSLPTASIIGTSSIRRISHLKFRFPHLKFQSIRGNIRTRLQKLDSDQNEYSAIILAYAGLKRMGLEARVGEILDPSIVLPPCGQGIIAVQCKKSRGDLVNLLSEISCKETYYSCFLERLLLKAHGGGCCSTAGIQAKVKFTDDSIDFSIIMVVFNPINFDCLILPQKFSIMPIWNEELDICERCEIGMTYVGQKSLFTQAKDFASQFMKILKQNDHKDVLDSLRHLQNFNIT